MDHLVEDVIGPVLEYDQLRWAELTRTLETFLTCHRDPEHTARTLGVHPTTLARRLDRIDELLGPTWRDPAPAREIQFALLSQRIGLP
ncbi:helix-turn-helix domain-containing protein [Actinopolyspora mortivallis]|uniref:helix-turn-helix domain-containing protein n=1 Tax=Actinopolyspora mortivallis TaxID=33906 RepID=UPI000375A576|nr:helix-turn-helix domain-containing protein [Actinopolyspora mortivallis]